jgi:hypothetical protein
MVPIFVSTQYRYKRKTIVRHWAHLREALIRWAVALDQKIGDLETAIQQGWNDCIGVWPSNEQPIAQRAMVESTLDPLERERIERERRSTSMMTKGRWR